MVQVTLFSGHEGRLRYGNQFYLTLFGGCEVMRPTLASQILVDAEDRETRRRTPSPFFLTIFGGAEIKCPTLAEEFIDLREMLMNRRHDVPDWEKSISLVGREGGAVGSFTLFAGFDECALPSENEEVDALAMHRHLGNLSDAAGQVLQCGVGQRNAERYATVRQAVLTDLRGSNGHV